MRPLTLIAATVLGVVAIAAGVAINPIVGAGIGGAALAGVILLEFSTERIAWLLACVLVFVITWNGLRVPGGGIGTLVLMPAIAAMAAHAALNKKSISAPPPLLLCALGFWLATLLVMIFPPGFDLTNLTDVELHQRLAVPGLLGHRSDLLVLIEVEISLIATPLVMIAAGTTPKRCRILLDLWVAGLIVNCLVGVLDTMGIHLAPTPISAANRSVGLTIHPNYLALSALLGIPPSMLWIGRSRLWTLAGLFAVASMFAGVYASGSRAGAVSSVFAFVITSVAVPRLRRYIMPALPVIGMIAIVVLMYTKAGDHILHQVRLGGGSSTETSIQGSNLERIRARHVGLHQFEGRPVTGVGFSVITDAHSIYLQLLAAGGFIALISFFVLIGGMAEAVVRGIKGPMPYEVMAVGLAIFVWLVNGVVDNQVGDKYLYVLPGILFAMARLAAAPAPSEAFTIPQPPRPMARAVPA